MLRRCCAACPPPSSPRRATAHRSVRFVSIRVSAFCPPYNSVRGAVGRAKPPARHFDVAQVLRGVAAAKLSSAGNGASFSAFRQHTLVRLLPALQFSSGGPHPCCVQPTLRSA